MNEDVGQLKREIARLNSQLGRLESASRQTWVYHTSPPVQTLRRILVSTSANNKSLGYASLRGAVWNSSPLSAGSPLASAYDPTSETAITDDGIAYATDGTTGSPCLIINREVTNVGGGIITDDLPQTCTFLAYRQIPVPVSGGLFVLAWEAYWA